MARRPRAASNMTPSGITTTMETKPSSITSDSIHSSDDSSDFHHVTALVFRWTLDFSFRSLCRHFKEDKLDDFDLTLKKLEANCEGCELSNEQAQKRKIAAFLGRIMHGSHITDGLEGEGDVMPLIEATSLWQSLRDTVADEEEYNAITTLLHVQSVGVCLEEGRKDVASTALKWLKETQDIPKNLAIKLSTLVAKGDCKHPYMRNYPYRHLREKVQSYLDAFLAENPSDFLLKAAMKVTQCPDSSGQQDQSSSQTAENSTATFKKSKKRLFNSSKQAFWLQQSGKKPQKVFEANEVLAELCAPALSPSDGTRPTAKPLAAPPLKKGRKKWTPSMDKVLTKAVKKHGEGNWKLMLLDHSFNGRTGTMLKDRWRILKRETTG